jgi:sarcosine oxidase subunit gamma
MSNLVSALNHAMTTGFATVEETGLRGMITLRGDLSSKEMKAAVKGATGAAVPACRKMSVGDKGSAAWMSSDELLVVVAYDAVAETVDMLNAKLKDQHAMVVNVSDARAVFKISGAGAREVLAKVAPVDLSAEAFGVGDFRRSRLAQVAAAFWVNEDDSLELVCFRSVAQYVYDVLCSCSATGSEVRFLS